MFKVIIIGGKGTAVNIADQIEESRLKYNTPLRVMGFAIDDCSLGQSINGFPVICKINEIMNYLEDSNTKIIFSLYKSKFMRQRIDILKNLNISLEHFISFVHPSSFIAPSAKIGPGSVVLSNSTIQTDVEIGCFNIINSNTVIEHNSKIGNSNVIAPAAYIGSECEVKDGVFVGANSTIREKTKLSSYSIVGMSSVVTHNVRNSKIVFGNPAREYNI